MTNKPKPLHTGLFQYRPRRMAKILAQVDHYFLWVHWREFYTIIVLPLVLFEPPLYVSSFTSGTAFHRAVSSQHESCVYARIRT